jgi:hypothetical protein
MHLNENPVIWTFIMVKLYPIISSTLDNDDKFISTKGLKPSVTFCINCK